MPWPEYTIAFRKEEHADAWAAGRTIGQAQCGACDWSVVMTGDTRDEVDQFLSARLIEHVIDAHTDTE